MRSILPRVLRFYRTNHGEWSVVVTGPDGNSVPPRVEGALTSGVAAAGRLLGAVQRNDSFRGR